MRRKSGRKIRPFKDGVIAALILVLGTLISAKLDGLGTERFSGRFNAVDGDTVARNGERFRLVGIDAPELSQTCQRGQQDWPCGADAKAYLSALLKRDVVDCSGNKHDRYQRLLVRCSIGGRDVAAQMVAAGFAVTTEYFLFSREQAAAQSEKAGIWAGTFMQPGDWRREHKAAEMDAPLAGVLSQVRYLLGW